MMKENVTKADGRKVASEPRKRPSTPPVGPGVDNHAPGEDNATGGVLGTNVTKRDLSSRRRSLQAARKASAKLASAAASIAATIVAMQTIHKLKRRAKDKIKAEAARAEQYRQWCEVHYSMNDMGDALADFIVSFCDAPCFAAFRKMDAEARRKAQAEAARAARQ